VSHGYVIPGTILVPARATGKVDLLANEDFLLDKLVLRVEPAEALNRLLVLNIRVGGKELVIGPTPATLFSAENVWPSAGRLHFPPPPGTDLKNLMLMLWNALNGRPANAGLDEEDQDHVGGGEDDDPPPGTTIGPFFVRKDQTITVVMGSDDAPASVDVVVTGQLLQPPLLRDHFA